MSDVLQSSEYAWHQYAHIFTERFTLLNYKKFILNNLLHRFAAAINNNKIFYSYTIKNDKQET